MGRRANDGTRKTILGEKVREALASVLPITAIVLVLCLTLAPLPVDILLAFLAGAVLLILGMGFFTLGADMAMTPIGEHLGARMAGSRKLWVVVGVSFAIGLIVTLSEPDLQVLAGQVPGIPNMVLIGIALFLTLITMNPVLSQIQTEAWEPYTNQEIGQEEFLDRASVPLKGFMLDNTEWNTVEMFCELAHVDVPETRAEAEALPLRIIVPSFMTQELQRAFYTGFLLYIPFLLIDIVVSSTLMSMGMIMLPPAMISTPFKLLLFVSVNGWQLLFSALVQSVK